MFNLCQGEAGGLDVYKIGENRPCLGEIFQILNENTIEANFVICANIPRVSIKELEAFYDLLFVSPMPRIGFRVLEGEANKKHSWTYYFKLDDWQVWVFYEWEFEKPETSRD
jgi:hypothetical protein